MSFLCSLRIERRRRAALVNSGDPEVLCISAVQVPPATSHARSTIPCACMIKYSFGPQIHVLARTYFPAVTGHCFSSSRRRQLHCMKIQARCTHGISNRTPDDSPPPESAKHKSGTQQQQQEVSTTITRDMLLHKALALFMPGKAPQYAKHAATAAAADGATGNNSPIRIPNLPHLADSRELQLVAAAFAAGAAAGASGQLTSALPAA